MKRLIVAATAALAMRAIVPITLDGQQSFSRNSSSQTVRSTVAATDIASVRQWDQWVRTRERDGSMRVRQRTSDVMLAGREHERLEQYHRGVRIHGAGITRQWQQGQLASIFGEVYDAVSLDVTPVVLRDDAAKRAGCTRVTRTDLVIYPSDPAPALTWRVSCYRAGEFSDVFIHAVEGTIVDRVNRLHTQSAIGEGRGVYFDAKKMSVTRQGSQFLADDTLRPPRLWTLDLRGNLGRAIDVLTGDEPIRPSDIASDADNMWDDGAVVDAHAYVGWTYDYLFKRFGRRGLDDNNTPIVSIVHPVLQAETVDLPPELLGFAMNAFWCGECGADGRGIMVFGDGIPPNYYMGNGQTVTYFSASLDIVAHELVHGLTDFTSGLIYQGESGALNEAFSDIMATSAEFFYQPVGSAVGQADYLIGEDSYTALVDGINGTRSMAVPTAFGDPDHYSERYRGSLDEGGVHINSGIINHAFYLAIEGGTHRLSEITVPGVGPQNREQIERIFYRAFTHYLPPRATFSLARIATLLAARDLYGSGSPAERAVTAAWNAVGVQ